MDTTALAQLLKKVSYVEGDFTLSSGRTSTYIIDKYMFETNPELLRELAKHLAAMLPDGTELVAGAELGGVPLAVAVALETGLPYLIVKKGKKGYGTDKDIEGPFAPGARVVLLEDVATTAGQALKAADKLRAAGLAIETILCVVDREEGAAENVSAAGLELKALFRKKDLGIRHAT